MELYYRKATRKDVYFIVQLLSDDPLGQLREKFTDPLPEQYYLAFDRINRDDNQDLMLIETEEGEIVGTLQLSVIPYLTYQGGIRAQIEAVRIHEKYRGQGLGKQFFQWAIQRAKEKGAHVLQLTTDKKRPDAIEFYKKLGFIASHEGMKLHL